MEILRLGKDTINYIDGISKVRDLEIKIERLKLFIKNPNNLAYFVVDKNRVVAFAWGYILERIDNNSMLYVHSVDVIKDYQNQGLCKKIIKEFLDVAKQKQLRNTFLITDKDNIAANKCYSSFTEEIEKEKILYIFK